MPFYDRDRATEDGNIKWKVTTGPSIEPVSVDEVKLYARIDGSIEDTLIESFIKAVRQSTEKYLGRALIEQTITASLDYFTYFYGYGVSQDLGIGYDLGNYDPYLRGVRNDVIYLPRPPLISVTEVRTVDEDGNTTTYSSSKYYVRTVPEPGELVINFGETPPINMDRYRGGFEIEYKAGYGDEADDVAEPIRLAMMMWTTEIYENRVALSDPSNIVKSILAPYRIIPV